MPPATTSPLTQERLAWIERQPRTYAETMEAWRSCCPRLTIWEDALADGLVDVCPASGGKGSPSVIITARGSRVTGSRAEQPMRRRMRKRTQIRCLRTAQNDTIRPKMARGSEPPEPLNRGRRPSQNLSAVRVRANFAAKRRSLPEFVQVRTAKWRRGRTVNAGEHIKSVLAATSIEFSRIFPQWVGLYVVNGDSARHIRHGPDTLRRRPASRDAVLWMVSRRRAR